MRIPQHALPIYGEHSSRRARAASLSLSRNSAPWPNPSHMGYVIRAARVAYARALEANDVYVGLCFVVVLVLLSYCGLAASVCLYVYVCVSTGGVRTARGTRARGSDVGAGGTMCSSPCRVRRAVPCGHSAVPGENATHNVELHLTTTD